MNYWQEYETFANSHQGEAIAVAIDNYKRLIEQERGRAREGMVRMRQEEERLLQSQQGSRFETEQEKVLRLTKERELREFGKVGISFCLATPNPNHTYCGLLTDLNYKLHPQLPRPSSSQLELMYEMEKKSGKLERVYASESRPRSRVRRTPLPANDDKSNFVHFASPVPQSARGRGNGNTPLNETHPLNDTHLPILKKHDQLSVC